MPDNCLDLRSLVPTFERTITWPNGDTYNIREIDDLLESEFISIIADEQQLKELSLEQQHQVHSRHMQMMLVVSHPSLVSTAIGKTALTNAPHDLQVGDILYVVSPGNVERNVIEKTLDGDGRFVVEREWTQNVDGGRLLRAVRTSEVAGLTERQFMAALTFLKKPPDGNVLSGGEVRPQNAAS